MSDLYDKIISQRGSLPGIVQRIPGFPGYLDLTARRAADRMIRNYVADRIQQQLDRLAQVTGELVDLPGGLAWMSEVNSARTKWQTYHDRVLAAAPGYLGFFELTKVDALAMERLYSFDEAQMRYADELAEAVKTLESAVSSASTSETAAASNADIGAAISGLSRLAGEANEAFSLRVDVITQIGKSEG
jgi:hypothetical protein